MRKTIFTQPFDKIDITDIPLVGGKNASLGEMTQKLGKAGVRVPPGFAVTVEGYNLFLLENKLKAPIADILGRHNSGRLSLDKTGASIRRLFLKGKMPLELTAAIRSAYAGLCKTLGRSNLEVAVRSSATAEDLPEVSFAGQLESFLNIRGEEAVVKACQKCFASLFTNRAIIYRNIHGFDHMKVALSVGIQQMVRSDEASSGVMFSIDTETGFPDAVVINAAWGLGEGVVQGLVNPDEYMVFKPLLKNRKLRPIIGKTLGGKAKKVIYGKAPKGGIRTVATNQEEAETFALEDKDILALARWAAQVEAHYRRPMDMEWARDAVDGKLYMLQARPETGQVRRQAGVLRTYSLKQKGKVLIKGLSIGEAIASGEVCIMNDLTKAGKFPKGAVLVTPRTDPDWVPLMRRASALVTDHGGRTSHAAIVSRELGLPAIIGTGTATRTLATGQEVTVCCAEGDQGFVYQGRLKFEVRDVSLKGLEKTKTRVMLNMANPAAALRWWQLPSDGIGLARMEFIINNHIKVHPMALVHFDKVIGQKARKAIEALTRRFKTRADYFIETLAIGIAHLAASQYPNPIIVRLSDFKTDEYANLIGGEAFEPREENPMLGWRGASRYYDEGYRAGFALECRALKRVREDIGFENVVIMVPFCRTVPEADAVLKEMAKHGLERGTKGLQVYVMAEIPSNIILAEDFAARFDGFSIGSNDLTQLTLGVDRNSERLANLFDARDPAVTTLIFDLIKRAHKAGTVVGFCGQAPSDDPEYAKLLVDAGIDSLSVTPDSFVSVKRMVAKVEAAKK